MSTMAGPDERAILDELTELLLESHAADEDFASVQLPAHPEFYALIPFSGRYQDHAGRIREGWLMVRYDGTFYGHRDRLGQYHLPDPRIPWKGVPIR